MTVDLTRRASELFHEDLKTLWIRTDRMFAGLMVFQWLGGIVAALWISPRTWIGTTSETHIHVWAAIILGGLISAVPVTLALIQPGRTSTRHAIAIGQVLTSALLIHLTGGRIETHFHVFGSLAFLAFYRDVPVLLSASCVVALDHFLRGLYWPQSVYGIIMPASWRWLEHAGWVLFEDAFLILSIIQGRKEMRSIAERQTRVEAARQELEAFSYSVSHDLRAPLRHMGGFASLLKTQPALNTDTRSRRFVEAILESAVHMGNLIDDLLVFSRMARVDLTRSDVPLQPMVVHVQQELQQQAAGRRIDWRIEPLPVVRADPAMLRLVFVNLLSNAMKYTRTRDDATIHVGTERRSREIVVWIRDNGVGFDMQYIDKLFGVFQRLHRADEFEGTGIGLANVRRIIDRHGGRTWAEGETGRGATFYFSLPNPGGAA
ncbi:MAG: sensor histidine kinase [Candidatus Polarisedimenticolia bacterium]